MQSQVPRSNWATPCSGEHHRQVLALRFLADMSVDDRAALLAVPPGTVTSRIHRALKVSRRHLEADGREAVNGR